MRDPTATYRGRRDAQCHKRPATGASSTASQLTLRRKYSYRGRRLSYFNAACPALLGAITASYPLALLDFNFAGAIHLQAGVTKSCRVKP